MGVSVANAIMCLKSFNVTARTYQADQSAERMLHLGY